MDPKTVERYRALIQAMHKAAKEIGLEGFFHRAVAAQLPDNPWLDEMRVLKEGDRVTVTTRHLCVVACGLSPYTCLTALKVEDTLSKQGALHRVRVVQEEGPGIRITLEQL